MAVVVVRPRKGAMEHTTVQPGSVQAFESVQLYAKASGYLKTQAVDIGDRVKRGQPLAVVAVPDLEKQAQRHAAAVELARAQVSQREAQVVSARADLDASKAAVTQAEANAVSAAATLRFRTRQLQRMKELYQTRSIEEQLVDESQERHEAAFQAAQAAKAAISTTRAQVAAAAAKITKAEADVVEARAEVRVAQAELERAQVLLDYATVVAPFDGVVTQRSLFPGDFVRSASEGGVQAPLLTVQRTDRMRVVVQVPDREVPFLDAGDPAEVEVDALPGEPIKAKVSRVAMSEDATTRLMHVEIDVPNPDGRLRQGMFGRVAIQLERPGELLSIPSACLVGKAGRGRGQVYVVRGGTARLTTIGLGADTGVRVAVLGGLSEGDEVIVRPGGAVADGMAVRPRPLPERGASAGPP